MSYNAGTRVEKTDEYRDWIDNLKDLTGRARILMRVDRLIHDNPWLVSEPDPRHLGVED